MHGVRHHKGRIEAQPEMADNLFLAGLVLVFFQEIRCAGECNLVDIFLHLVRGHAKAVVDKFQGLFFRVYYNLDLRLKVLRKLVFAHQV